VEFKKGGTPKEKSGMGPSESSRKRKKPHRRSGGLGGGTKRQFSCKPISVNTEKIWKEGRRCFGHQGRYAFTVKKTVFRTVKKAEKRETKTPEEVKIEEEADHKKGRRPAVAIEWNTKRRAL